MLAIRQRHHSRSTGSPLTSLLALEPALEPRAARRRSIRGCLKTPSGASDSAFDMMSLYALPLAPSFFLLG